MALPPDAAPRPPAGAVPPAVRRAPLPPPALIPSTPPWLYATLVGNGSLLVGLDDAGSPAQVFYPHIDAGPHLRAYHLGVQVPSDTGDAAPSAGPDGAITSWLAGPEWAHEAQHIEHAAGVDVVSTNATLGARVARRIVASHERDVLVTELRITNLAERPLRCQLALYAAFDVDYRRSGTSCHYDEDAEALVFFAADRYFALAAAAPVDAYAVAKTTPEATDELFAEVSRGTFNFGTTVTGQVGGAVRLDLGELAPGGDAATALYLCCERSLDGALRRAREARAAGFTAAAPIAWWRERLRGHGLADGAPAVREVYERSLIALDLLTDRATGAITASAEVDPDFRSCDGYAYCWPRDGALTANALDSVGLHERARPYHDWALRAQEPSGLWYHRYYSVGGLGPTWGLVQLDETGASVWAICRHVQLSGDLDYGRRAFPQLVRACAFLHAGLDARTGLAPSTRDLWEERDGISAYTCACTWGAFHELSLLAAALGEGEEAGRWRAAAAGLKAAIERHLWDPTRERFLRGLDVETSREAADRLRQLPGFAPADLVERVRGGRARLFQPRDAVVDASLLSLSFPFGVFAPDDPRMAATAEAVRARLMTPSGGVMRYSGDRYRGGNAWIICTLWLAWHELAMNRVERARELFDWVVAHRTRLDLLAEQIDYATGEPCWVVPLTWSHAVYLVVARAFAERGLL